MIKRATGVAIRLTTGPVEVVASAAWAAMEATTRVLLDVADLIHPIPRSIDDEYWQEGDYALAREVVARTNYRVGMAEGGLVEDYEYAASDCTCPDRQDPSSSFHGALGAHHEEGCPGYRWEGDEPQVDVVILPDEVTAEDVEVMSADELNAWFDNATTPPVTVAVPEGTTRAEIVVSVTDMQGRPVQNPDIDVRFRPVFDNDTPPTAPPPTITRSPGAVVVTWPPMEVVPLPCPNYSDDPEFDGLVDLTHRGDETL